MQVMLSRLLGESTANTWRYYFAFMTATVIYGDVLLAHNMTGPVSSWITQLHD